MLRGMGWKKGEPIGGKNKGLTAPIEFIPRSQGLGLGAERRHEDNGKKPRKKPGDEISSKVERDKILTAFVFYSRISIIHVCTRFHLLASTCLIYKCCLRLFDCPIKLQSLFVVSKF